MLNAYSKFKFAWSLLKNLGHDGREARKKLKLKKSLILDDLRVLDLYEEAIVNGIPLEQRQGNWVQKFRTTDDGSLFVGAQFFRCQEVEQLIKENFEGSSPVLNKGDDR